MVVDARRPGWLRHLMGRHGFRTFVASRGLSMRHMTLWRWYRGRRIPTLDARVRFFAELGVERAVVGEELGYVITMQRVGSDDDG